MTQMLLLAELAGVRVALPAAEVRSVIEVAALTPVPLAPPHVAGLTAVRSQALTVIDSRAGLGLPGSANKAGSIAVVISSEGLFYAVMVDAVHDVKTCLTPAVPVAGGYGAGWNDVAVGMVELDDGPALLLDPYSFIFERSRQAA